MYKNRNYQNLYSRDIVICSDIKSYDIKSLNEEIKHIINIFSTNGYNHNYVKIIINKITFGRDQQITTEMKGNIVIPYNRSISGKIKRITN